MRTQASPQSHARCCRTCSTEGDAMRSLPICRAFLKPFASSCKGSSTLGFVRRVTESDCRRPLRVGVRHDDVRVSVRAVDILSRRGVGRLRIWVYGPALPSAPLAEGVECWVHAFGWLSIEPDVSALPGPAVGSRRAAESAFWASSLVCLCVDRRPASQPSPQPVAADPSLDDPCGRRRRQNPPPSSAIKLGAAASGRSRGTVAATGARTTTYDPAQATVTTGAPLRRGGQPPHGY
jgi:hypothetical protein